MTMSIHRHEPLFDVHPATGSASKFSSRTLRSKLFAEVVQVGSGARGGAASRPRERRWGRFRRTTRRIATPYSAATTIVAG